MPYLIWRTSPAPRPAVAERFLEIFEEIFLVDAAGEVGREEAAPVTPKSVLASSMEPKTLAAVC